MYTLHARLFRMSAGNENYDCIHKTRTATSTAGHGDWHHAWGCESGSSAGRLTLSSRVDIKRFTTFVRKMPDALFLPPGWLNFDFPTDFSRASADKREGEREHTQRVERSSLARIHSHFLSPSFRNRYSLAISLSTRTQPHAHTDRAA